MTYDVQAAIAENRARNAATRSLYASVTELMSGPIGRAMFKRDVVLAPLHATVVKVWEPADHALVELGNRTFALIDAHDPTRNAEIYYDHEGDGSGTNNLILDWQGMELDLEFMFSRAPTEREVQAVRDAVDDHYGENLSATTDTRKAA